MPFNYFITSQENIYQVISLCEQIGGVVLSFDFYTPITISSTATSSTMTQGSVVFTESISVATVTVEAISGSQLSTTTYEDSEIEDDLLKSGIISASGYLKNGLTYLVNLPLEIQQSANQMIAKNYIAEVFRKRGNYFKVV